MTVTTDIENKKMTAAIDGRLDASTSPELESKLKDIPAGITELNLDLKDTEYV